MHSGTLAHESARLARPLVETHLPLGDSALDDHFSPSQAQIVKRAGIGCLTLVLIAIVVWYVIGFIHGMNNMG